MESLILLRQKKDENGRLLKERYSLFDYQIRTLNWMVDMEKKEKNLKGGIISLSMGLGKTLTSLCLICNDFPDELPTLVICSKSVLNTWKEEIEKFVGTETLPFIIFQRDEAKDIQKITFEDLISKRIVITTYDSLKRINSVNALYIESIIERDISNRNAGVLSSREPELEKAKDKKGIELLYCFPWRRIIADESQTFANSTTTTFFCVMALWGKNKWCLSGTPIRNYAKDLYSQFRFCGLNTITNVKDFNQRIYDEKKLVNYIMQMDYKEAGVTLPELKHNVIQFNLEGNEQLIYETLLRKTQEIYALYLQKKANFSSILAQFIRLRQSCIAPYLLTGNSITDKDLLEMMNIITEDKKEENSILENLQKEITEEESLKEVDDWMHDRNGTAGINSKKNKAIHEIVDSILKTEANAKIIIFSMFVCAINLLREGLSLNFPQLNICQIDGSIVGVERQAQIEKFRKSTNPSIFFATYKTGSEGLNLTCANHVILEEPWWSPSVHEQAIARSYRTGQKRNVNVWYPIISQSIEYRIYDICSIKYQGMEVALGNTHTQKKAQRLDSNTLGSIIGYTDSKFLASKKKRYSEMKDFYSKQYKINSGELLQACLKWSRDNSGFDCHLIFVYNIFKKRLENRNKVDKISNYEEIVKRDILPCKINLNYRDHSLWQRVHFILLELSRILNIEIENIEQSIILFYETIIRNQSF